MTPARVKDVVLIDGTVYALVALPLVKELYDVLGGYLFSHGGTQNNDEVFDARDKIVHYLEYLV